MCKIYSANYWSIGFKSKLYDRLSPESYYESMRQLVEYIPDKIPISLLDAGCGSGLLLNILFNRIREGMSYTGVDLLQTGVAQTLIRAEMLGISNRVSCFKSDLTSLLIEKKFDVIVGHFSMYTISSSEKREKILANFKTLMKPEGVLILVNPSVSYDANSIIDDSVRLVRNRYGFIASLIRKFLIYPLTKAIGLRFVEKQLRLGMWKAYAHDELLQELEGVGFTIQHIEEVYAGSAFLVIGRLSN
jgi:SAM-dependent methyltransferase